MLLPCMKRMQKVIFLALSITTRASLCAVCGCSHSAHNCTRQGWSDGVPALQRWRAQAQSHAKHLPGLVWGCTSLGCSFVQLKHEVRAAAKAYGSAKLLSWSVPRAQPSCSPGALQRGCAAKSTWEKKQRRSLLTGRALKEVRIFSSILKRYREN